LALCIPMVGAGAALLSLAFVNRFSASALVASIAMLQLRLRIRSRIASRVLPAEAHSIARTTILFATWAWPLIHLVHCAAFLCSCLGRRFTWAGIGYRLDGRNVLVAQRKDPCQVR
jgi:hypothetical protein